MPAHGSCYGSVMVMHSDEDPIRAEALRVLDETPGLDQELAEFERRLDAGEITPGELHSTTELRERLRRVRAARELE